MSIKFSTKKNSTFTLVEFEIEGGIITPDEIKNISPPEVDETKGVGISGRGPVWLFCFLTHAYHPVAWVGTFEPRTDSIIVTSSHVKGVSAGDSIPNN